MTAASRAQPEPPAPSHARSLGGLVVGTLLWAAAVFVAHAFPTLVLGRELTGPTYAIVAVLFAPLALGAVFVGLRLARCGLADAGFTLENARADVLVGAAVAVSWALLQFLVLIPLTGGAERADVVVNAEQIGTSVSGLLSFLLLAWGGGFAEEVFFRAHLMTTLRRLLGPSRVATALVVLVPTVLFAMLHGYQGGWVGIFDTGVFGGATLPPALPLEGKAHADAGSARALELHRHRGHLRVVLSRPPRNTKTPSPPKGGRRGLRNLKRTQTHKVRPPARRPKDVASGGGFPTPPTKQLSKSS